MNLANFERLTNYFCIFLLYVPNVEVGTDASKLYGKCFDPFSEGINTYENANEHEIISLIQLSESTSMPPNPVKSVNSNEHNKNETAAGSQKPSCKMPFIKPGTLTKKKFNSTSSFHNNLILFNDKNKTIAVSTLFELALSMNERKHATRKKRRRGW